MKATDKVRVTTFVAVDPQTAFDVFTRETDLWWRRGPRYRFGGARPGTLMFELTAAALPVTSVRLLKFTPEMVIGALTVRSSEAASPMVTREVAKIRLKSACSKPNPERVPMSIEVPAVGNSVTLLPRIC